MPISERHGGSGTSCSGPRATRSIMDKEYTATTTLTYPCTILFSEPSATRRALSTRLAFTMALPPESGICCADGTSRRQTWEQRQEQMQRQRQWQGSTKTLGYDLASASASASDEADSASALTLISDLGKVSLK